ncbi:MAG: hypothetical protein KC417_13920, partial [Myxococcales bacterium]|nr:hypothetical protein [Myxococcales bacterium]
FLDAVATAGDGSKVFSTSQAALNALSDAMFYVEKEVKDMKVGIPVGRTGCDDEICPEDVEAPFSGRSKEHILANLKGFELVFLGDAPGTDAEGFDDLLVSAGAEALATKIKGDITTSREALENVDGTLEEALVSDKQSVDDVYDAMNAFVRDLKTEFVSVLDLELPKRVEADAD